MKTYMTINQTVSETGFSEDMLRTRLKRNKLPGFYSATRYYVNVPMLMQMLDEESRLNASIGRAEEEGDNAR
nr:MAG TPA: Regulatory protein [Caudoviricetes sp.]